MSIPEKLQKLQKIYQRTDEQIATLKEKVNFSCVQGCGKCCTRFEPYISTLEAIPIANYLNSDAEAMQKFQERSAENKKHWRACPFYDYDSDYHCSIYSIRPTICRLFGFSVNCATGAKKFATCKMIETEMPQKVKIAQKLTDAGLPIPVYQEVYKEIRGIDFHLSTDYHPFSRSIEIALEHKDSIESGEYAENLDKDIAQLGAKVPFGAILRQKLVPEMG